MPFKLEVVVCLLCGCAIVGCAADSQPAAPGPGGVGGASGVGGGGLGGMVGSGGETGLGGAGGVGGGGGSAGEGGFGGFGGCPDALGNRPSLTAQPTLDSTLGSPGSTVTVDVPVSRQTRLVRARAIVENTVVGEAEVATTGAEVVSIELTLDGSPPGPLPDEAYIGLTLCDEPTTCLSGPTRTFVSYVRLSEGASLYAINVFDDGLFNPARSGTSCFEALTLTLEPP